MITLKSPPLTATRVLHLNCYSSSPGGKDYVLVKMTNGELWGCNGPALTVRNGGGAVQHPRKSWSEIVGEKTGKGYRVIGEYSSTGGLGAWWSDIGETYASVSNMVITPVPVTPVQTAQTIVPEQPVVQRKQSEAASLTTQYPLSDKLKSMLGNSGGGNEWFLAIPA